MALAPERLVEEWLRAHRSVAESVIFAPAFPVPYQSLAETDGWVVWLDHPPVSEGLPLLPAPEALIWNDPQTAIATALLVSADYAVRRGASSVETAFDLLQREGPVAIVAPGPVHRSLEPLLEAVSNAGVAVVRAVTGESEELRVRIPSFAARADAHGIDVGRAHDPGLSFEILSLDAEIGDTADSSFVLHDHGVNDGLSITGELGPRMAIAIGLGGGSWSAAELNGWQSVAAGIPAFLGGIACRQGESSLVLGWPSVAVPTAEQIGGVFHAWLKAFTRASIVDVRLCFAAAGECSDELSGLREHARGMIRDRALRSGAAGEYTTSRDSNQD